MPVALKVYANDDDALLYWSVPATIPGCRGFAIEYRKTKTDGTRTEGFLENRTGFATEQAHGRQKEGQKSITRPSTEWPFQRFSWADHSANAGDTVSYRVTPVLRDAQGKLTLDNGSASGWSQARVLGRQTKSEFKPFFNRGYVMSQFMARYLKDKKLTLSAFKKQISDQDESTIRRFLSGDLRLQMLAQLDEAAKTGGHVFAALFELGDTELVDGFVKLGKRAHLVLANGSIQAKKGTPAATARKQDENKAARARLAKAGVDVSKTDRFISPGALGHNKFLVRTDKQKKPLVAWTGSTNWTTTGLCTQLNNGLLIENPAIAKIYLDQWNLLRKSRSEFPKPLTTSNAKCRTAKVTNGNATVWFTRCPKSADLEALREAVESATQGVLFLMFMPGAAGLFSTVAKLSGKPNLYVRGAVTELPHGHGDESAIDVNLVNGEKHQALHLDIVQAEGATHPVANFAEEVTRKQFLSQIGHAIIHSKCVVVDPFSDNPKVITGSHNFSTSASTKNDENFIIIEGDKELAEAYAVNIMAAYDHYKWRAFLSEGKPAFNGLEDDDKWMAGRLKGGAAELRFWGV